MSSELKDDDPPIIASTSQVEDFIHLTSFLCGEEIPTTNNDEEASTSQQQEQEESTLEDMNRGWIR